MSGRALVLERTVADSFTEWAVDAEPRLSQALIASFGPELGQEAAAEALSYAWEHWDRISTKDDPLAYVFVIGRNRARRRRFPRRATFFDLDRSRLPEIEPGLPAAVARLSEKQRIAVMLVHCFDWSLAEVAQLLGVTKPTVQKHVKRGLEKLRKRLGVVS